MKKFSLFIFLVTGVAGISQPGNKPGSHQIKEGQVEQELISKDSMLDRLQKIKDSATAIFQTDDSNQIRENISRNVSGLLQLQKEQKSRQKKTALVRLAIGAALLVVLIIGLRRRKK